MWPLGMARFVLNHLCVLQFLGGPCPFYTVHALVLAAVVGDMLRMKERCESLYLSLFTSKLLLS